MQTARIYIVAEIGVNHNGSVDLAKKLVDAATDAGADAVKLQSFQARSLVSESAPKAAYQQHTTDASESQYNMLHKLQLSTEAHRIIAAYCKLRNIDLLSTPFDMESLSLLADELDVPIIKVASGDITHAPLLEKIARTGKKVIVSTGMSTLGEIEQALAMLAFGFTQPQTAVPTLSRIRHAYISEEGQNTLGRLVTLLHATTDYPARFEDANLRALHTLSAAFRLPIGLSDHTEGIAVPIAAAALGASVIEKHLTLDRNMAGPDHRASLEPADFRSMVIGIRQVEASLGSSAKLPSPREQTNAEVARRSIVAAQAIASGEILTESHLAIKRPGGGRSPFQYWELLGTTVRRAYDKDEML
ncbi:N-acetylneuraminate synthase [Paenibacillus sp. 1_12]|uniref:N-acetylneuraminate synthase n=1 Tax=Paenibacillus sp. 1_12 TaxID=1566278 RepID=UPI0008EA602D|nr:N-acetylneuraminate synthase [Paenibacillus sp. 1_12]SFK81439.1 N-acetylneuraminate synthase [Paenibacillus sp. 1_12]